MPWTIIAELYFLNVLYGLSLLNEISEFSLERKSLEIHPFPKYRVWTICTIKLITSLVPFYIFTYGYRHLSVLRRVFSIGVLFSGYFSKSQPWHTISFLFSSFRAVVKDWKSVVSIMRLMSMKTSNQSSFYRSKLEDWRCFTFYIFFSTTIHTMNVCKMMTTNKWQKWRWSWKVTTLYKVKRLVSTAPQKIRTPPRDWVHSSQCFISINKSKITEYD